jgi:1-acyl-sn-glycerol-3-phosphate acyltransferase
MRRALRLLRIGLHLLAGYAICALLYPLLPARARVAVRRSWARGVLAILGVRLRVDDLRVAPGSLVVSNHVSWLDAVVLNALLDAAIVAKSETRRWSLLGMMLERNDTLFIERRVSRALLAVNAAIGARLAGGVPVIIFPEGTTTDGADVLTFRPALFQPAVAAGHPVHALALLYRNGDGQRSHEAAFIDDMSLWHSLCAVTSVPALRVEIHSCVVLASTQGLRRREAARLTHRAVQDRVYGPRSLDAREEAAGPIGQAATAAAS